MATFSIDDSQTWQVYLAENVAFSEAGAPGPVDAYIFLQMTQKPEEDYYPNICRWFDMMASLQYSQLSKLADQFNNVNAAPTVYLQPDIQQVPQSNAPIQPKSLLIIQVKADEASCNFVSLAHKIYQIQMVGLAWNKQPKILPIAFGMCKLQISCTIEVDKVITNDLIELIQQWDDDVQSVEIVAFQKI